MEQIKHVITEMRAGSDIERRNRALVAFTVLTGARDSAIASMRLRHVDLAAGCVYQDARQVKTKFSKTFTTYFLPVGEEIHQIVVEWVTYLRQTKLWGNDDPLFPATETVVGANRQFQAAGLKRQNWNRSFQQIPFRTLKGYEFQSFKTRYRAPRRRLPSHRPAQRQPPYRTEHQDQAHQADR